MARRIVTILILVMMLFTGGSIVYAIVAIHGRIGFMALLMLILAVLLSLLGIALFVFRLLGLIGYHSYLGVSKNLDNPRGVSPENIAIVCLLLSTLAAGGGAFLAVTAGTTLGDISSTLSAQHKEVVELLRKILEAVSP